MELSMEIGSKPYIRRNFLFLIPRQSIVELNRKLPHPRHNCIPIWPDMRARSSFSISIETISFPCAPLLFPVCLHFPGFTTIFPLSLLPLCFPLSSFIFLSCALISFLCVLLLMDATLVQCVHLK